MVEVRGNKLIEEISGKYNELTKAVADVQNGAVTVLGSQIEEKKSNLMKSLATLVTIGAVSEVCVEEFERHLNHSVQYFRPWSGERLKSVIFA